MSLPLILLVPRYTLELRGCHQGSSFGPRTGGAVTGLFLGALP